MELAGLIDSGAIAISALRPKCLPLDEINDAISGVASGDGGFTSYLVEI